MSRLIFEFRRIATCHPYHPGSSPVLISQLRAALMVASMNCPRLREDRRVSGSLNTRQRREDYARVWRGYT
jgi:hypothetical protein